MAITAKVTKLVAELMAAGLAAGWNATSGEGDWCMDDEPYKQDGARYVRFEKKEGDCTATVSLTARPAQNDWERDGTFKGLVVEGHTFVNGGCFTRRGIDCSSVSLRSDPDRRYGHDYGDLETALAGEWERCAKVVAARKTAVAVPGLPFVRQPEWFTQAAEQLRAGKRVQLTPHGFGTGYTLSTRPERDGRHGGRSPRNTELEAKLGVSPVYVSTFDYD